MTPKLLVLELWGVGDLALATDFLRAASETYAVTLLAKPSAEELKAKLWPTVKVAPFTAPWTALRGKYRLWNWPWSEMRALRRRLREEQFDVAVSARPDPRDHWVMWRASALRRLGYAHAGGGALLTESLEALPKYAHRYDHWRGVAEALDVPLPVRENVQRAAPTPGARRIVVHTGAAQATRIWPLDRFAEIVKRMRAAGFEADVLCDEGQRAWWVENGESAAVAPESLPALMERLQSAAAFVGNDSGPGHLAATLGVRTFSIFGPSLPESFATVHPHGQWIEGEPCPHKPCFDSCRFAENHCLLGVDVERVWDKLEIWLSEARKGGS